MIKALKEIGPDIDIRDLKIPFRAVAADLHTGEEVVFANVRTVEPLMTNSKELLLVVSVSERKIASGYSFLGEESYIVTESGTIVSAVKEERLGQKVDAELLEAVGRTQKKVEFLFQRGQRSYYSVYLPTISCYLVVNTPAAVLESTRMTMLAIAAAVILFGMIFSLIWSNYISALMTRPLMSL